MLVFHAHLSTTRIPNGHQETTVTTTSHWSQNMIDSLGPQGTLVTGTKSEPVAVKSISETHVVNLRLLFLDERANFWGPPVSTGNRLLRCRYIVGMFVTSVPNEVCYSVIIVCNEL
jgi:hypothetical protein